MIKKIIAILLAGCLLLCFSGCSLNFFSIESLLSPPKQPGKNGEVQEAFNKLKDGSTVQLKSPLSGDYQTSVVLKDINNDGEEEAFVFYSDSSLVESSVRLAFLEYKSREWVLSSDIKGAGNGIYDVSFEDLNSDGTKEVFISWSLLDAGLSNIVSVFEFSDNGGSSELKALANEYCNAKYFVDINSDNRTDLALVYLDDTGPVQKSFLRFFTLSKGADFTKYGEIELDSAIASVVEMKSDTVISEKNAKTTRLFIECLKNERMAFTELVYWDNNYSVPVKVFKQPSVSNLRNIGVRSLDIDADGLLEVPFLTKLYGNENTFKIKSGEQEFSLSLIEWYNASGDKTKQNNIVTLHNSKDKYLFIFPWKDKVTVYYDSLR